MPYVCMSMADALRLARLEARSLRSRAAAGGSCGPRWRSAAESANKLVRHLRAGRGAPEGYMYQVADDWKAAADCEGLPGLSNYIRR